MNYKLLKQYVKASPFTLEDISSLINLPYSTFNWKVANNRLTVDELVAIAEILGLSANDLIQIINYKEQ